MSTVYAEIQSLSPSAMIELFIMDLTLQGGPVLYFHAGTNELNADIIWTGQTYTPFPVQATGFKQSGIGALPRPKISASNVQGAMSSLARQYSDLVGCKLTRVRTFARFLDAANFPGGVNAGADPTQALPNEIWYFDRKSNESASVIEFELAAAMDVGTVTLPRRHCGRRGDFCARR
jgi:lambda family phage minor tail protein L